MDYCPYCMRPAFGNFCGSCGKPLNYQASPFHLPAGTILGAYRLGAVLGQGGFGITYIALDTKSGRRVAIKEYFPVQCCRREGTRVLPSPGKESLYQGGIKSFLEEARLLHSRQGLPNVVHVLNFFEAGGTAYLVMEYLEGVTLQQKIASNGPIPSGELMPKLPALLASMQILHNSGIIHRDISPDNIMWMPDGTLKLLDFGCARSMEDGKSMTVQLKHGFAPVEQYMTRGQGPWTDVYALCATVYYCLTGKVPPISPERLEKDTLVPPSALGVSLPPNQEKALLWGLQVQPKTRPATIEALAKQLYPNLTPQKPPYPPVELPEKLRNLLDKLRNLPEKLHDLPDKINAMDIILAICGGIILLLTFLYFF